MQNISLVAGRPGKLPRKAADRPHLTLASANATPPPGGWKCSTSRPAGMVLAGGGWKVETVDLTNVSGARPQGDSELNGQTHPDANGLWIMVKHYPGRVWYVRTITEAQDVVSAYAGDWSDLTVRSRWIFSGPELADGTWSPQDKAPTQES